jgi:hypothetical protein
MRRLAGDQNPQDYGRELVVEHQPDAERADEAARVVAAMKTDGAWRSAISL